MKKLLLVLFFSFLLSGCITLDEGVNNPGMMDIQPTTQPTCPVCPTCPPGTGIPPTSTPTPTQTATITSTPTATSTCTLRPNTVTPSGPTPSTPTPTLTRTATNVSLWFTVQAGMPIYLQNFVHDDKGCNWMGVAGQVFDKDGSPLGNVVVVVKGSLNGAQVSFITLTGFPSSVSYGPGGYEIQLANAIYNSGNTLSIQLFDSTGVALSNPVPFSTYANCSKNLILINFIPSTQ
jgi:hypothetical protein